MCSFGEHLKHILFNNYFLRVKRITNQPKNLLVLICRDLKLNVALNVFVSSTNM
jgi:hypothetical protein